MAVLVESTIISASTKVVGSAILSSLFASSSVALRTIMLFDRGIMIFGCGEMRTRDRDVDGGAAMMTERNNDGDDT